MALCIVYEHPKEVPPALHSGNRADKMTFSPEKRSRAYDALDEDRMMPSSAPVASSPPLEGVAYELTDGRVEIRLEKRLVWRNDENAEAGCADAALPKLPLLKSKGSFFDTLVISQPS